MSVRIASGNELKKERTFINKDGTLTTPEEAFRRNIRFTRGDHSQNSEGEGKETTQETT